MGSEGHKYGFHSFDRFTKNHYLTSSHHCNILSAVPFDATEQFSKSIRKMFTNINSAEKMTVIINLLIIKLLSHTAAITLHHHFSNKTFTISV